MAIGYYRNVNNMQQLEHTYVVQVTKANTGNVNGMSVSHSASKHVVIQKTEQETVTTQLYN